MGTFSGEATHFLFVSLFSMGSIVGKELSLIIAPPESLSIQLNLHTHDAFCVFQDNLLLDMYLVSHVKTLYSQIRNRALCQVFQDFFTINNTVIENRTVWLHILTLITMETKTLIKH